MGETFYSLEEEGVDRLFLGFEYTAFRLETLQVYRAPEEAAELEAFLAGADQPAEVWDMTQGWLAEVSGRIAQGKRYQRVRVVTEPLSDYLRYECAWGYAYSTMAGEDVRVLSVTEGTWPEGVPRRDYWLFDSVRLLEMHYTPEGEFVCAQLNEDPVIIVEANRVRDQAVHHSVPYAEFAAGFDAFMHRP
ncbi:hypothetical protein F4561_001525 [Lipingzhangella halophila]|uniref:DUF6879 domain-containing protein n=1 Tax=Lipingzhangella halophila TaxID=1783352 RepID=A0A7W7W2J0_9ACTN|nr:DUF6879 family protein [Lipingzhangella halophila]MBB4930705.1 hypothetical protein [Lipingzhangella halophila]